MNLATRIAYQADRRRTYARALVRAEHIRKRTARALRRQLLTILVAVCAVNVILFERNRHAEEVQRLEDALRVRTAELHTLESFPEPVALVVAAPSRGALRSQLATISGQLDAVRYDLR